MTEDLYLLTICLPLATILIVFGMRYAASVQQARLRLGQQDAWRQIAETAAANGTQTATALSAMQAALAEVKIRLAAIEKILKDIE